MIYLNKILPLLFSPLFIAFTAIFLSLIFRSKKAGFAALALLVICSLPIFSENSISYLEKEYQLQRTSDAIRADAVVVLSGMVRTVNTRDGFAYEWADASDRIYAGINLIKDRKASSLVLTRGKLPWSAGKPEGEYLREVAIQLGVPEENIFLTEIVENTNQEAKAARKLLSIDNPSIILVTSAFHMPRAKLVFEAAGFTVLPFAVDFRGSAKNNLTILDFVPSASALADVSFVVRELIGRAYYKFKY